MLSYKGTWEHDGEQTPLRWSIKDGGEVINVSPVELQRRLYGELYIAHVNHQNLKREPYMRIPCSVTGWLIAA